jgi:hypothetical protein
LTFDGQEKEKGKGKERGRRQDAGGRRQEAGGRRTGLSSFQPLTLARPTTEGARTIVFFPDPGNARALV